MSVAMESTASTTNSLTETGRYLKNEIPESMHITVAQQGMIRYQFISRCFRGVLREPLYAFYYCVNYDGRAMSACQA